MAQDMTVAEAIYQHVLGTGDPSSQLAERGELPPGWAQEYRRLLALARAEWLAQPLWPRCLVAAMHYALLYLDIRYAAWRSSGGGGHRNEETERELASVTAPTRIFFAQTFSSDSKEGKSAAQGD
jgi:hypothetical protein